MVISKFRSFLSQSSTQCSHIPKRGTLYTANLGIFYMGSFFGRGGSVACKPISKS